MSTHRFSPVTYDAAALRVLQQVFDSAWATIEAARPSRDRTKDEELRTRIAKAIVAQASEGVSDPEELREAALRDLLATSGRS
jgi:hypothetical protein